MATSCPIFFSASSLIPNTFDSEKQSNFQEVSENKYLKKDEWGSD